MHTSCSSGLNGASRRHTTDETALSPGQRLLEQLLASSLILREDWELLQRQVREELQRLSQTAPVLNRLVELELLTDYQAERLRAGKGFGLVLGNYRVLGRLGAGGMGVVFKAEHIRLRRQVAIKVLPVYSTSEDLHHDQESVLISRFFAEVRAVAQLQHTNIVAAIDAGEVPSPSPDEPILHYFVMEYVPGQTLEEYVCEQGPLPPITACDLVHQTASALMKAHKHQFIHRDVKPSNILVTSEGQAKLLDFGLSRDFQRRLTQPGVVLGTVDFMAPEQARDASSVDIRADIYGLGGVLFWCLTGRRPFSSVGNIAQILARRLTQSPPSARALRPEIPVELDAMIARMMAVDPVERYADPQSVMQALLPFVKPNRDAIVSQSCGRRAPSLGVSAVDLAPPTVTVHRILIADDEPSIRTYCRCVLQAERLTCDEACNGVEVLELVQREHFDLLLLDVGMPEMSGLETLRRLRALENGSQLKIIMVSGRSNGDEMAQTLLAGADDFLTKPFSVIQLQARVRAALRLKAAQDRYVQATRSLLAVNAELERSLTARDSDLVGARNALILALAKLVQSRDTEPPAHLARMQRYCETLAEGAAVSPAFADAITPPFIDLLVCCAPLHDIGKVALPDHILMKPGKLEPEERLLMQAHTAIGSEILSQVAKEHPSSVVFLQMGIDIARHHHERYDGTGYPDQLSGSAIPLAARIVAVADVYDALRSRRAYKPPLSHATAVQAMIQGSSGQFDPVLLQVFERCAQHFERIFRECPD